MKWFTNLKTLTKLMLGFAIVILLIVAIGVTNNSGVNAVQEKLRIVYEDYTVAGTDLARIAMWLGEHRAVAGEALLTESHEVFIQKSRRLEEIRQEVQKSLNSYA